MSNIKLVKRRGELLFLIDTRPSKKIRRAKKRIEKRQREISHHLRRKEG